MKTVMEACLVGSILICAAGGQDAPRPALRQGVSVQLAVAGHAAEMRAADEPNAMVVAITAEGKVYAGVKVTEPAALSSLSEQTVYVKADARVPYQKVLTVLDALHGKSVVLLTESPAGAAKQQGVLPPYGMKVNVSR
jgi:hypothetical protein